MATLETSRVLEDQVPASPASLRQTRAAPWKPAAIASDIATLGAGTLVAGVANAALVFVIPKLISVEGYGYWRLFMLYAGYVGFLHFGFADGALLRWAGRSWDEFRNEVGVAAKYLFWQHLAVLVPLCAIAIFLLPGQLRFAALAVGVCAVLINESRLLQFGLEGARIFRPVAVTTILPPALLLALVLLWHSLWQSSYEEVTAFYAAGWAVALAFLLLRTKAWRNVTPRAGWSGLAKGCVLTGWPIVMANTGVLLIAGADRLAVSWAAPIQEFAQYSLAASVIGVPVLAIQACSKVFFSHLAAVTQEDRRRVYSVSSRALLIAWALLLPYYFVLSVFVRDYLPKYVPSLQYARVLLLGIPFLAVIQILQMSYAYLHGTQKRFLAQTMAVLAISLGLTSFVAFRTGSLLFVAAVQVVVFGGWWTFNEWSLQRVTGQRIRSAGAFLTAYLPVAMAYWISSGAKAHIPTAIALFYVVTVVVLVSICREEMFVLARSFFQSAPNVER